MKENKSLMHIRDSLHRFHNPENWANEQKTSSFAILYLVSISNQFERKSPRTKQILSVLSFAEAMRLISDIKNDHFEPINFIQVS